MPIFFAHDLSGNHDKSAMQFDAVVDRFPGVSVWSSLFIFDLNGIGDFFGTSRLNRWAFLAGGRILSPIPSRFDADLTLEFSAVRPWTYMGQNSVKNTFVNFGLPMGSELGPDSRTLHARLSWRPCPKVALDLEAANLEKGVGRQATLGSTFSAVDPVNVGFFSGGIREFRSVGLDADLEMVRKVHLLAGIGRQWNEVGPSDPGMTWKLGGTAEW